MNLDPYLDKMIDLELSGKVVCTGYLIDYGPDLLVIYNGKQFQYLPFRHVKQMKLHTSYNEYKIESPADKPTMTGSGTLAFRDMLTNAKGLFVEISVNGRERIYGHLFGIMDDYLILQSHIHKTLFVSTEHVKWLVPFEQKTLPYGINLPRPGLTLVTAPLAATFEQNLQNLVGNLVVFDMGEEDEKIGLLQQLSQDVIELVLAGGETVYWNVSHLKTVHVPQ